LSNLQLFLYFLLNKCNIINAFGKLMLIFF